MNMRLSSLLLVSVIGLAILPQISSAQTVFSGSGVAAATTARDNFRTAIGGGTTVGANGSFGGVRREINWDGVPAAFSAPNNLPANFFNVNSPRGAVFTSFGSGFQVSGATTDNGAGQPAAPNFGNIDPSYTTTFIPFSQQRLFTAVGSNIVDITFFIAGTNKPGTVRGFGSIFSDVDLTNVTSIQYFDASGQSLGTFSVLPASGNQTLSFLGVVFNDPVVRRVRITNGNAALGAGVLDNASNDVVTMDDFLYSEPVPAVSLFSGAGLSAATTARDAFRTAIGGGPTAGANGSFGGLRREINWDGVPAAFSAPNNLPANFFNVNSPRGVLFTTPGTGFQVSGATTDSGAGQPAPANFGNIDPSYTTTFTPFSPQRLFTALGSNVLDVSFFVAGTTTPAVVQGFGSIFSDVDLANVTSIEYFDTVGRSLGKFFAPSISGNQTISFLGALFSDAIVNRVRITTGTDALATGTLDGIKDLVVMDDFLYNEPVATPAQLLNISTRARVLTGDQVSFDGFIISGTQSKSILVRGIGPSLTSKGVPGALQDPVIELYTGSTLLKANDNWKIDDSTGNSQQTLITNTGLAPTDDRESAILFVVAPGTYTTILRGKNNSTGVGVVEIYDLSAASGSILGNISGRAFVDTGDNVLIGGFISGGGGGASTRIIVRGLGPSLTAAGVPGALQDPTLDLFNGNGTPVGSNDNWRDSQQSDIQGTGLAPTNNAESAITGLFPAGPYTAIERGKNNTTGIGLVEIYQTQ